MALDSVVMPVYVALLRGINLAGRSRVGMADLRRLFADLGHTDVTTYLQSGNVVFASSKRSPSTLARGIERAVADELDLEVSVLLRTADEMAGVVAANPFVAEEDDVSKLHVTFLDERPDRQAIEGFEAPSGEPTRFAIVGREVFLHCPAGYGGSKLNNAFVERKLKVAATTRNWNTTGALRELSSARG